MKYLLLAFSLILSGCAQWEWKHNPPIHYEWKATPKYHYEGGWADSYNYYVVDPNSDTPDAFFKTLDEAKGYKKEFAANHDYVIVKIEEKYQVYNMQLDN